MEQPQNDKLFLEIYIIMCIYVYMCVCISKNNYMCVCAYTKKMKRTKNEKKG